jgi:hypothetical protein
MRYRRSRKGRATTARRVARWRTGHAKNVTHTSDPKVGPSAIVTLLDAAPPAMEAGVPSATSEEATDERSQEGGLARRAHDEDVAAGGSPEDDEGEQQRSRDPSGDGEAPADVRAAVAEQPRCARCGRAGVVEVGGEEAVGADDAPWLQRVRPARRTRSAP